MKTPFRLSAHSVFAAAFLSDSEASTQVILQDYDPDLRLLNWTSDEQHGDSLFIDINDNGVYDLLFWVEDNDYLLSRNLFVEPNDMITGIYGYSNDGYPYAQGVSADYLVGPDMNESGWMSGVLNVKHAELNFWSFSSSDGCSYMSSNFLEEKPYYLLKLNLDGNTHYGWTRLQSKKLFGYPVSECATAYGSPLTVFEIAYEATPGASILAATSALPGYIDHSISDIADSNTFEDILLHLYNYDTPDFEELRIYMIADSVDALNFSVAEALALPAENYAVFDPPDDFVVASMILPSDTKDIHGNNYDSEASYTAYYMEIPYDDTPLTLSAPSLVLNRYDHACELFSFYYDVTVSGVTGTASDITVAFAANMEGEEGLSAYRICLDTECDHFSPDGLEPDQYVEIPKEGEEIYITNLEGILRDVDGNPIIPGLYYVRLSATPDNYYNSISCVYEECGIADFTPIINPVSNPVSIIQSDGQVIVTIQSGDPSDYQFRLMNAMGGVVLEKNSITVGGAYFPRIDFCRYICGRCL